MSKLKEISLDYLEHKNDTIRAFCCAETTQAEAFIHAKVVIPYCKKHGYSFESGMGTWNFRDRDGEPFYPGESRHKVQDRPNNTCDPKYDADEWFVEPTDEDREIREILSYYFDCSNTPIGAHMKDYKHA